MNSQHVVSSLQHHGTHTWVMATSPPCCSTAARTKVGREATDELRRRTLGYQTAGAVLGHLQRRRDCCTEHGVAAAFSACPHALASSAAAESKLSQEADRVVHALHIACACFHGRQ